MLAMITSVEPRALRPVASASDSRSGQAAQPAADQGAAELADARHQDHRQREQQQRRIHQRAQVHAEAGDGEEHRG